MTTGMAPPVDARLWVADDERPTTNDRLKL
jgi:hypothetical protein